MALTDYITEINLWVSADSWGSIAAEKNVSPDLKKMGSLDWGDYLMHYTAISLLVSKCGRVLANNVWRKAQVTMQINFVCFKALFSVIS